MTNKQTKQTTHLDDVHMQAECGDEAGPILLLQNRNLNRSFVYCIFCLLHFSISRYFFFTFLTFPELNLLLWKCFYKYKCLKGISLMEIIFKKWKEALSNTPTHTHRRTDARRHKTFHFPSLSLLTFIALFTWLFSFFLFLNIFRVMLDVSRMPPPNYYFYGVYAFFVDTFHE